MSALLEFHRHLFSQRAWILTVVTVVSIGGHLRIGSPQTAIGAFVFTAVQIWFALRVRKTH